MVTNRKRSKVFNSNKPPQRFKSSSSNDATRFVFGAGAPGLVGSEGLPLELYEEASEFDAANVRAENLIRKGINHKRKHKYAEADRLYLQAVATSPTYLHGYYALGKLYYLMNNREKSLLHYTIAAHLHLGLGAHELDENLSYARKVLSANHSPELIIQLHTLHPHADLLLVDDNTARHLGHSLIELQAGEALSAELTANAKAYRQNISGGFFAQSNMDIEEAFYHPVGVSYLVDNIQWSKVGRCPAEEVMALYSAPVAGTSASQATEVEYRFAMSILAPELGVRFPETVTPVADLLREVETIYSRTTVLDRSA